MKQWMTMVQTITKSGIRITKQFYYKIIYSCNFKAPISS